jgi:hydroxyacylglutathione hydrolase
MWREKAIVKQKEIETGQRVRAFLSQKYGKLLLKRMGIEAQINKLSDSRFSATGPLQTVDVVFVPGADGKVEFLHFSAIRHRAVNIGNGNWLNAKLQRDHNCRILRQSGCSNYEKPFLYLLFGKDKALLLDTGAGKTGVAQVVNQIIDKWLARTKREPIQLIVSHTHAHRDHAGGDEQFKSLPRTTVVAPNLNAVQSFFGIKNWPEQVIQYDMGDRIIDVIPIPGHETTSIAIYDRQTAVLFTGDTLYPGRLYVKDPVQFVQSIQRLVDFTQSKIVAHILGNHIENSRTPYLDYKIGTVYQPDEHALELGRGELLELNEAVHRMSGRIVRMAMRDFTIWPLSGN